jgi:NADP-dependent 3-hydroxy acid dehydrogenase YdfG
MFSLATLTLLPCALTLPDSFSAGRTAVITGAGAGLGKAAALTCAQRGMRVCLVDIDEAKLAEATIAVSAAAAEGEASVMSACLDVSDRDRVFGLADDVYERFGEVGLLMSNAGAGTGTPSALKDVDKWKRSIDVNFFSALHVLQAFVPRMLEQGTTATVVATGSKQGITARRQGHVNSARAYLTAGSRYAAARVHAHSAHQGISLIMSPNRG